MTGRDGAVATAIDLSGDSRWSVTERDLGKPVAERLADDVRAGLKLSPPTLPARWFYDERGSILFDQITRLPEYYPTRRETEILTAHADDIAGLTRATTLVELGSGTSEKTRLLLDAFSRRGPLRFVPIDVSVEVLTDAARTIAADYEKVTVEAIVADFDESLAPLPSNSAEPGERMVAFLGGTIGNLAPAGRAAFFARLRAALAPGDHLLLGADLKKDADRLVAAYDDAAGVTAEFNRNLIAVLARELDATGLSPDDFEHLARWNAERGRIEMWLRAVRDVHADLRAIDLHWDFPAGAEMLTEISTKFDLRVLQGELTRRGFRVAQSWTDPDGDFSLTLARAA
jgi:L-histidine N-alpha-methyltransferase